MSTEFVMYMVGVVLYDDFNIYTVYMLIEMEM